MSQVHSQETLLSGLQRERSRQLLTSFSPGHWTSLTGSIPPSEGWRGSGCWIATQPSPIAQPYLYSSINPGPPSHELKSAFTACFAPACPGIAQSAALPATGSCDFPSLSLCCSGPGLPKQQCNCCTHSCQMGYDPLPRMVPVLSCEPQEQGWGQWDTHTDGQSQCWCGLMS